MQENPRLTLYFSLVHYLRALIKCYSKPWIEILSTMYVTQSAVEEGFVNLGLDFQGAILATCIYVAMEYLVALVS